MPEAPEVQELADFLASRAAGHEIAGFDLLLGKALKTPGAPVEDLIGGRITGVSRYAKMIDIAVDDARHGVVHFGHDGWVLWHDAVPEGTKRAGDATLVARVRLDDGSGFDLTDAGQWKALTVHVVPDPADVPAIAKLGPDPTAPQFSLTEFAGILTGRKKQVKALLQDQTALAGIGNAYSDEALHAAKISPVVHASTLSDAEIVALYNAVRTTLIDATAARRGVPPHELRTAKRAALRVHRRGGERCPVCGDTIRDFTFSGALAQYCPTCQTAGVLLA